MIFVASDLAALSTALSWWEDAEYFFTALVIIACFGEYAADFTDWFTDGEELKKRHLAKYSTLLLVASLSLELVCLVRTNILSSMVIGSLGEQAGRASGN